jgi:dephospho-CoA kinase
VTFAIGLTGGIGSGKSAVAEAFAALGVDVTDTDQLAHALTQRGEPGHAAVLEEFGPAFVDSDGALDRGRLRRLVFDDHAARARLEAILHPLIRDAARREVAHWRSPYGVLVVPLLLERGGLAGVVARVLVVDCPEEEQVRRVVARSGLTAAEVRAIMATQLPRAARLAHADDILDNAGPLAAIAPQVAALDRRYRELAARAAENRGVPASRSASSGRMPD